MGALICVYTYHACNPLLWIECLLSIKLHILEIVHNGHNYYDHNNITKRDAVVVQVPATCFLVTSTVSSGAAYNSSDSVHHRNYLPTKDTFNGTKQTLHGADNFFISDV